MSNRTCPICDKEVVGRKDRVYCSKQCGQRGWRRSQGVPDTLDDLRVLSETLGECERCKTPMTLAVPRKCGGYSKRRFCSDKCRNAAKSKRYLHSPKGQAAYRARVESGGFAEASARMRERNRQWVTGVCPQCGSAFRHVEGARRVLCGSHECAALQKLDQVHEYRARSAGLEVEAFTRREIFERDNWVCQICGDLTDRGARGASPSAPTLDHVVPISRGGGHTRENVQCAHFHCNVVKSDKLIV